MAAGPAFGGKKEDAFVRGVFEFGQPPVRRCDAGDRQIRPS